MQSMHIDGGPSAYDQSLGALVAPIEDLKEVAEEARETLIRQQSLALGAAVYKLALHHHGLAEQGTDVEEVRATITQMLGDLGLSGTMALNPNPNVGPDFQSQARDPRVIQYAQLIDNAIREKGVSAREVGRVADVSHTHLRNIRRGAASWAITRKVAVSLGLLSDEVQKE